MATSGLYQPIGRIDPVAPSPSILTSARPLPAAEIARVGGAALEALKVGEGDWGAHLAAVESALSRLWDDDDMYVKLRPAAQGLRDHLRAVSRQAAVDGGPGLDTDTLYRIADQTWRSGVSWNTIGCQQSFMEASCTDFTANRRTEPGSESGPIHTDPFTLYTPLSCDWIVDGTRLDDDALAINDVHSAWALARALWLGQGLPVDSTQPTLRRNAVDLTPAAGAVTLDVAAATLLSAYDNCTGGSGGATLHVPTVMMVGALGGVPGGGRIAEREANYYRAAMGALVSPGPGYPHGFSPQGATGFGPLVSGTASASAGTTSEVYQGNALNEVWVYISGPVEYALGPSVLPLTDIQARNYGRTNQRETWAQRLGLVRFDPCCVYACKVQNYAGAES